MSDYVSKEEFKELKSDVKDINKKVDNVSEQVIRLGCDIEGLPNKVIAQLIDNVYNNCPRGKTIESLDRSRSWIITIIVGSVIVAILKTVMLT